MSPRFRHRVSGFTLVELMVTLGVAAILLSIGVPAFGDYVANQRVRGSAQTVFSALSLARAEAIKRNAEVEVKAHGDGWSRGWRVGLRLDEPDELVLRLQGDLAHVDITATASSIKFKPNGRPASAAAVSVCDTRGSSAVTQRTVSIDSSGLPNISLGDSC